MSDVVGDVYVTRDALLEWCEQTGRRPPFLYRELRDTGKPKEWGFTHDTKLLEMVRWVVKTYWEGKEPETWPTKALVIEKLTDLYGLTGNEAEAVDLVTRHDDKRRRSR